MKKVLDYEVDGASTDPSPNCEICIEKKQGVAEGTPKPETVDQFGGGYHRG